MSKISVAMAVYNGEKFLSKQLDSILLQLEKQDEIVVSYDKSTDGTRALLAEYESRYPQVKVVENKNPGIAGNFANAVSHSSGDYIFICDQDDAWAENKRSVVVGDFETYGCDMVIHNGVHIDAEGSVISDPFFTMYRIGDGKLKNILKPRYSGCCTAFTKKMAETILPIPADIDAYDHWIGTVGEFFGKIHYESEILLYHRLHGDNVTAESPRALTVILKARFGLLKHLCKRLKREKKK